MHYVLGGAFNTIMSNTYFSGDYYERYENHKIRRYHLDNEYTGGFFQGSVEGSYSRCALFGTPLTYTQGGCEYTNYFPVPVLEDRYYDSFNLLSKYCPYNPPKTSIRNTYPLVYFACTPFRGGDDAPEFVLPSPKNETEITNFYDRITVKDTPSGTNYQIYSVTGQLIQTGTTNPDISTTQLSRGMYILRLENGKAFKFVK